MNRILAFLGLFLMTVPALAQPNPPRPQARPNLEVAAPSVADPARLLDAIDADIAALDRATAMDALQTFAAEALESGRIDAFRAVIVKSVDGRWKGLDSAETALNMISWLPDTAEFLGARIRAARIAIEAGALSEMEAERLWQGLRARVERVGTEDKLLMLARAQIDTGYTDTALQTVKRFHQSPRVHLQIFVALLTEVGPHADIQTRTALVKEIREITAEGLPAHARLSTAEAYWAGGFQTLALDVLSDEPDPARRVALRMKLLEVGTAPAGETSAATLPAPGPESGE